ncbi:hypothetical protein PoHVEF18_010312 [Penicillium ochrochloron]
MEVTTTTSSVANTLIAPPPFDKPLGCDCPAPRWSLAIKWRICQLTVGNDLFSGYYRIVLASQQPRVVFALRDRQLGQVIFTAKNCEIETGFDRDDPDFVNQYRDQLKMDGRRLSFIKIRPSAQPPIPSAMREQPSDEGKRKEWNRLNSIHWEGNEAVIWIPHDEKEALNRQTCFDSLGELVQLVRTNADGQPEPQPKAYWFYVRNPVQENSDRSPPMPWLFNTDGRYGELIPLNPFFIDEEDRSSILVAATRNERDYQKASLLEIFNLERFHKARLRTAGQNDWWYVDVTVNAQQFPTLSTSTQVRFAIRDPANLKTPLAKQELNLEGLVISDNDSFKADFTMFVRAELQAYEGQDLVVTAVVTPNLLPVNEQLVALEAVGQVTCFGDMPENKKKGYSLRKLVLGHGREVDRYSADYFELDLRKISPIEQAEQDKRLKHIENLVPLDTRQAEAVMKSTVAVPGGVHLIVGPPGTGKTRTAKRIILTLASLGLKVLVVAGSNKGVDNLFHPLYEATKHDTDLRHWCGPVVRFRSPAYQFATIRQDSARRGPNHTPELSDVEREIEKCQIHTLVLKHAQNTPTEKWSAIFLELLEKDRKSGVQGQEQIQFRSAYEHLMRQIFALKSIRVVASTLSTSAQEDLRLAFKPDVVVCDESGQCLEGDHMIPFTKNAETVRAVILLGDPDQLPPTVTSEGQQNEGAQYLKRSLMARLCECGYPSTLLNINYRNHPQILALFNRQIYKGKLAASSITSQPERVGDTWDEFTRKRHHFYGQDLAGIRRLFISVIGYAKKEEHGTSFENLSQAVVIRDLLAELYSFKSAAGEKISAEDVMVISPYKAQRRLISRTLKDSSLTVRDNLTVDAAQGQEAPIVLLSLTKPGENVRSLGFVASRERLNVALSRAQKVLIVVGNMAAWNEQFMTSVQRLGSAKVLRGLLEDVRQAEHVLTWVDRRTVAEVDPEPGYIYVSHVKAARPAHPVMPSQQDAMDIDEPEQEFPARGNPPCVGLPQRPSPFGHAQPEPLGGPSQAVPSSLPQPVPFGLTRRPASGIPQTLAVSLPARPPSPSEDQRERGEMLAELEARRSAASAQATWYSGAMRDHRDGRSSRGPGQERARSRSPRR